MSDEFRFETFVDAHSNIFREYLSSVIAKLPESNEDYRAVQEQMEVIFEQYPKKCLTSKGGFIYEIF